MAILVLSAPDDPHADHVVTQLGARSAQVVRFDPATFPRRAHISLAYSPTGGHQYRLCADGVQMDLEEVSAIWYRRPGLPLAHEHIHEPRTKEYIELECNRVIHDLWSSLDATWIPGRPQAVLRAEQKAFQLKVAGSLGFELPPTLITNRPSDLIDFYRRHDGHIISKQAATAFPSTVGRGLVRFTELVTTRDISCAQDITYCPMILQAYIAKRIELRITVVGQAVFAAEIHSQAANRTRHDWRRYDLDRTPHLPHDLPHEVRLRCLRLVEALDLKYGAIDMIVTPDGRYVFLEINPNGQYLWIEQRTELPISDAVCDLLLAPDIAHSHASAPFMFTEVAQCTNR